MAGVNFFVLQGFQELWGPIFDILLNQIGEYAQDVLKVRVLCCSCWNTSHMKWFLRDGESLFKSQIFQMFNSSKYRIGLRVVSQKEMVRQLRNLLELFQNVINAISRGLLHHFPAESLQLFKWWENARFGNFRIFLGEFDVVEIDFLT